MEQAFVPGSGQRSEQRVISFQNAAYSRLVSLGLVITKVAKYVANDGEDGLLHMRRSNVSHDRKICSN